MDLVRKNHLLTFCRNLILPFYSRCERSRTKQLLVWVNHHQNGCFSNQRHDSKYTQYKSYILYWFIQDTLKELTAFFSENRNEFDVIYNTTAILFHYFLQVLIGMCVFFYYFISCIQDKLKIKFICFLNVFKKYILY